MYDNPKNLLFLLAAAPMATGCIVTSGDDTNDDGTSGDGDGDPTTTGDGDGDPATGDGDPTTGDGDPTTGDGDGDPTTTGDGDGDPTTTGDGDGDPTSTPCESYAAKMAECYDDPGYYDGTLAMCGAYVTYLENTYGPDCAAAWESYLVCISGVSCDEFLTGTGCPDQFMTAQAACNGGGSVQLLGLRGN